MNSTTEPQTLPPSTTYHPYYTSLVERQVVASLVGIIAVIGFCGNSLVILAVIMSRKLRTFTNVFVVNLALADLLTCAFLPWTAVAIVSENGWQLPNLICIMDGFCLIVCLGCSLNTLACIAINRLVLITKEHTVYANIYTSRKTIGMITFTWTLPIVIAIIPLASEVGQLGYDAHFSTCTWDSQDHGADLYALFIAVAFYPIQLFTIIFCYLSIFFHVRKHIKKVTASLELPSVSGVREDGNLHAQQTSGTNRQPNKRLWKRQVEVTKNLFYVVCAFLICLTPYVIGIVSQAGRIFMYTAVLLLCNSCLNFFVYAIKHPDFKKVFKCIFMCKMSSIPERVFCR